MTRLATLLVLALVASGTGLNPLFAQQGTLEWRIEHVAVMDPTQVKAFLEQFQRELAGGDRSAVCRRAFYPLRVSGPHTRVTPEGTLQGVGTDIRTPEQCEQQFRAIFTGRVVKSVLSARFEDLFANDQGVMISGFVGGGSVWLSRYCRMPCQQPAPIRIVTVNR